MLPIFNNPPEVLWKLFTGNDQQSIQFLKNIHAYNNALSLTSLRTTEVPYRVNDSGIYSFRIKGALYHNHGFLVSTNNERPRFA